MSNPTATTHGRPVVIAEAARGNNYRVLSAYTAGLANELQRRGWQVSVARAGEPEFLTALLRHAADRDAVLMLGHFFYDLRVTAQNHFNGARIGDLFRGRMCAMWADHPFTWFMAPRLEAADPRVVYCAAEPGFRDAAAVLHPQLRRLRPLSLPALYAPAAAPLPLVDRPIDVLVPLTFRETQDRQQFLGGLASKPESLRLAEALFARLRDERQYYPFEVFCQVMLSERHVDVRAVPDARVALQEALSVLSQVDLTIRNERRIELVEDLLSDSAGLRVHLVGRLPPGLAVPAGVVCEGPLDAHELGQRMSHARWVVHGHPTYPQAQHERVLSAMAAGCGVISDFAPVLADTFHEGSEWLHARPGTGLRALTADFHGERLQALADAARRAVAGRFEMPQHVDALLQAVETRGAR